MTIQTVSFARRHILGELHSRCETIELIPVYLDDETADRIGFVDQSADRYADSFSFHLPADVCKKLTAGHYRFSLNLENGEKRKGMVKTPVRLVSVLLTSDAPKTAAAVAASGASAMRN